MNQKDKIKQQLANLKASARDMEELGKIQLAIDLAKELNDGTLWIVDAKCDKIYQELIDWRYGK